MPKGWTRTAEPGWIFRLLPGRSHDASGYSTITQLHRILEAVMSHRTSPKTAAINSASMISHDPSVWLDFVGFDVALAESLHDEDALVAMVDYLVELASLPDAVNESNKAIVVEHIGYGGALVRIEPGEALVIGDGGRRLWRDLPGWSMNCTETFQGPELWLDDEPSPENSEEAKTKWLNLNAYLALKAINPRAQNVPLLANGVKLACVTLALALEHSLNSRRGRHVDLHVPAAAEWFRIAGKEIENMCIGETETMVGGDLWIQQGGGEICDAARLKFWKKRMAELGYGEIIGTVT